MTARALRMIGIETVFQLGFGHLPVGIDLLCINRGRTERRSPAFLLRRERLIKPADRCCPGRALGRGSGLYDAATQQDGRAAALAKTPRRRSVLMKLRRSRVVSGPGKLVDLEDFIVRLLNKVATGKPCYHITIRFRVQEAIEAS